MFLCSCWKLLTYRFCLCRYLLYVGISLFGTKPLQTPEYDGFSYVIIITGRLKLSYTFVLCEWQVYSFCFPYERWLTLVHLEIVHPTTTIITCF